MAEILKHLVGHSNDFFVIGEASFTASPMTLVEVAQWQALPVALDAQTEFIAEQLRRRCQRGTDPLTITAEWVLESFTVPLRDTIMFVLTYGRLPGEDDRPKQ